MLRESIEFGDLQPGDWLPSEAHLCTEFGAGRNSVRSALRVLVSEGHLSSRAGKGHKVRDRLEPAAVRVGPGCRITTRMPTEDERRHLGIPDGTPLVVVERGDDVEVFAGDRTVIETADDRAE